MNIETKEDRAINSLGAFMTMVETSLDGNTRFPIHTILSQWWMIAFKRSYAKRITHSVPHDIVIVATELFLKGCNENKVLPGKGLVKLHKEINSQKFYTYSKSEVVKITELLAKYTFLEITTSKGKDYEKSNSNEQIYL